ncbi:asparagine synthase [Bordetella pertussis]|nr:asparagine synthase [Bordetella pertussis]
MCGIVGIWGPLRDKANVLAESCRRIRHRGPDSNGYWEDAEADLALAHVRLAILDLTEAGHQPMVSACGRYVIVLNGEIYNHMELRERLQQDGLAPAWRGHSDTETVLACFAGWGHRADPAGRGGHVRHRALGPRRAQAGVDARPHGRETALLRLFAGQPAVRLGTQGVHAGARLRPRARSQCPSLVHAPQLHSRAAVDLRRHPQAAAGRLGRDRRGADAPWRVARTPGVTGRRAARPTRAWATGAASSPTRRRSTRWSRWCRRQCAARCCRTSAWARFFPAASTRPPSWP